MINRVNRSAWLASRTIASFPGEFLCFLYDKKPS